MRPLHPIAAATLTLFLVSPALPLGPTRLSTITLGANDLFIPTQNISAASVSITGMVKTPTGRAIKGAYIVIRDASTNEVVRSTYSSTFGYYRLDQIETGRSYVLSITHRRYLFALPAQLLDINEERSGVDFVGEPSEE